MTELDKKTVRAILDKLEPMLREGLKSDDYDIWITRYPKSVNVRLVTDLYGDTYEIEQEEEVPIKE